MLLALALADHASDDGTRVYPSIQLLCEKTRQSQRTVQYQLRRMEASGWLQMVSAGNGGRSMSTEYRINPLWLGGVEFDDLLPPQTAPTDIELSEVSPDLNADKGCNLAHKRVQATTQKGATTGTKGCNPRQKRVQPVAPANNHHRTIKNHQGTTHARERALAIPPKMPGPPVDQIIEAYHVALPSLPRVVVVGASRTRSIGRFWAWVMSSKKTDGTPRATTQAEGLAWVRSYFARAAQNDFVTGRSPRGKGHENWEANIDFLMQENGIAMVIERTERTKGVAA